MHPNIFKAARRTAALLAMLAGLFLTAVPCSAASVRPLFYTALGDSIATGYGLSNASYSYTSLFARYLGAKEKNLAVNGLDSAGLLKLLNKETPAAYLERSDVITISIGGNDLLGVITKDISAVESGNFDANSMISALDTAETNFQNNWPAVIRKIRSYSPHAVIIATTLINPYEGVSFAGLDLGSFADPYIRQVNSVIKSNASLGYLVADSYAAFQKDAGRKLSNAESKAYDLDPHPNSQGHYIIFMTHRALKITIPSTLRIKGPDNPGASPLFAGYSSYSAESLIAPLSGRVGEAMFTITDGNAEANGSTGRILFRKSGRVTIKATLPIQGTNIFFEASKTVNAVYSGGIFAGGAAAAAIAAAGVLAAVLIRKRLRREPRLAA